MTRRRRLAAWAWDRVPVQLWVWRHFTRAAIYCEFWTNERDFRERRRAEIERS